MTKRADGGHVPMTLDDAMKVLQRHGIRQFRIEMNMGIFTGRAYTGVGIYLPADDGNSLRLAINRPSLQECVDALLAAKAEAKQ